MSLMLGDSCSPAFNLLPTGGGLFVVSQSAMPLLLSSWSCELMVMLVRFAPDYSSMLLCNCLGNATFHFTIIIPSL